MSASLKIRISFLDGPDCNKWLIIVNCKAIKRSPKS